MGGHAPLSAVSGYWEQNSSQPHPSLMRIVLIHRFAGRFSGVAFCILLAIG